MREIEIKVRVRDPQKLLAALEAQGIQLGEPKKQHDVVYGLLVAGRFVHGDNWLRVRTEDDSKVIFTLKRSTKSGKLDSIEHEVVVDNADEMTAIVKSLGYELYSDLTKIRRKVKHGDIEICLDEVPGLGTFVEAEKLCEHDVDHDVVQAELWELFSALGLSRGDEVDSGYDVMLRQQQGLDI